MDGWDLSRTQDAGSTIAWGSPTRFIRPVKSGGGVRAVLVPAVKDLLLRTIRPRTGLVALFKGRFPPIVQPEPLVRILTNHRFQNLIDFRCYPSLIGFLVPGT